MHKPSKEQPYRKELPRGVWLYFNRLPIGISDADLQKFLHEEAGIWLPRERIIVQHYSDGSACKASVSEHELASLLHWLLAGKPLSGKTIYAASVTDVGQGAFASANR